MKHKKTLVLACLLVNSSFLQATVSINSSNLVLLDSSTSVIVDNTGRSIAQNSGVISVGTFGSLSNAQIQSLSSSSAIDSNFSGLGDFDFNTGDGLFDNSYRNVGNDSFDGQSIYTIIGNGSTIAASTQFLIFDHDANFVLDGQSTSVNETARVAVGQGNLIVGGVDNFPGESSAFAGVEFSAFNLVAVPEPSSSALLAIAGVGFILRRRR